MKNSYLKGLVIGVFFLIIIIPVVIFIRIKTLNPSCPINYYNKYGCGTIWSLDPSLDNFLADEGYMYEKALDEAINVWDTNKEKIKYALINLDTSDLNIESFQSLKIVETEIDNTEIFRTLYDVNHLRTRIIACKYEFYSNWDTSAQKRYGGNVRERKLEDNFYVACFFNGP